MNREECNPRAQENTEIEQQSAGPSADSKSRDQWIKSIETEEIHKELLKDENLKFLLSWKKEN
jgi:hypothetical protein